MVLLLCVDRRDRPGIEWRNRVDDLRHGLVFACITDIDNQGEVPKGSIIDRDNQASFSLIITDWLIGVFIGTQTFSVPTSSC